jgi:ABC-type uncharacterized transport system substrate-binding protein
MLLNLRRTIDFKTIVAAISMSALAPSANSHPHVWVTVETELLQDEQKSIIGFRHHWTFDVFYTSFAIKELDKNNDGDYSKEELQELAQTNVNALSEFGYFTFPELAGHEAECLEPRDYWMEYKDKALTLHFTLPLKNSIPRSELKTFGFAVYDPTSYVAFSFAEKNPVRVEALSECSLEVGREYAQTVKFQCR